MAKTSKENLAGVVGQRLKELRKAKTELGQKEIANELGITKQAISSYESGRHIPDISLLCDLADFYSCSIDYILGREDRANQTSANYSEQNGANDLLHSLDTIAEDEGGFLNNSYTCIINALSISKGNPQRRKFVEHISELLYSLAIYIESSTLSSNRISENASKKNLTPDDVAVEFARFSGFDDISKAMDDIRRDGINALFSFSTEAKKALRIRTGWKNN